MSAASEAELRRLGYDPDDVDMLRDYECPECGPFIDESDGVPTITAGEVNAVLGGDEDGYQRCPDCGEEVDHTLEASLDMLRLVAERHPEMAPEIAAKIEEASAS